MKDSFSKHAFRVAVIVGTRPEAIKLFPVVHLLAQEEDFTPQLILTGQHREMLDQVIEIAGLKVDLDLDIMRPNQTLSDVTIGALSLLMPMLVKLDPDIVLVQGDTTTAFVGALAAFYACKPVAHVEAGLRSGKKFSPYPEEINRRLVSVLTDIHLPPTTRARSNLLSEGFHKDRIHVTGNTVVDALLWIRGRLEADPIKRAQIEAGLPPIMSGRRVVLVTSHRRENFTKGIASICRGLSRLADREDIQIIFPVHPNPNVRLPVYELLGTRSNINLIAPLNYLQFVALMMRASLIITDSGGVQEEAPALGIPVLVTRDTTERPEAIEAGSARLIGPNGDRLYEEACLLMDNRAAYDAMAFAHNPYGDGQASVRIIRILREFLQSENVSGQLNTFKSEND